MSDEKTHDQDSILRSIIDALPALIAYVDSDERYVVNNAAYERWFGAPIASLTGRPLKDVVGDSVYAAIKPHIDAALAGNEVVYDRELTWPDGKTRYSHGVYSPHRSTAGAVDGFALLISDESETRAVQADRDRALRVAEQQTAELSAAIEQMPAGVYIWGHESDIITNRLGLDLLGLDSVDKLQVGLEELFKQLDVRDGENGQPCRIESNLFGRALSHGEHGTCELNYRNLRTNERVIVRSAVAPIRVGDDIVAAIAVHVDITKQRKLEQERAAATGRHAILLKAQQEIAESEADLDHVMTVVTRRAQEMTEADGAVVEMADGEDMVYRAASGTAAQHLGMRLLRATSLSGRCVAEGALLLCPDTELDPRVDRDACRKIGVRSMVVVPLQFLGRTIGVLKVYAGRPHAFDAGTIPLLELMVIMIVAAMTRVSETEARRALDASEERQRFALEGAGIGTFVAGVGSDSVLWSDTAKKLFGLPASAVVVRQTFYDMVHPEDCEQVQLQIRKAIAENAVYECEYRVVWPDGSIHWLAAKGRAAYSADGKPLRFEGTVQDIDERKRAQERQWTLLKDVLASVTENRLRLCDKLDDLPAVLDNVAPAIALTPTDGLRSLRQAVRLSSEALGFSDERWQDLMTAASEGGMNAITHGGGFGIATVSWSDDVVQVRVMDQGTGIQTEQLPKAALARGWSSKASLGHGLVMMLQSVDRLWMLTGPSGTTIVLEQERKEALPTWLADVVS